MEKKKLRNSSTGEPQQSQTVLIIEDDEALAGLLQRNLRRLGLEVEIALTGADAIDRVAGGHFDLALLDYRLPDMTGIKVVETLAEQKRTIPFIVTTGLGDERTAVELMKLGARDYLMKDATFLDRLTQIVERTLQELDTERRLAEAEESLLKQTQELAERMKELRCLFSLDELMKQEDITDKQFLDRLVSFIPAAMQYPEITNACITLDDKRHKNKGFKKTEWMLQDDIIIGGKKAGSVQVCYSEERPEADIGPFLKEERALVSSIAKQVGIYFEGRRSREALRESEEIFSQFLNYSPIYVFFKDENIKAIRLSNNYAEMLGRPISELLGKNMDDLFPSDLAKSMVADDKRILKEGKEVGVEEELNGRFYSTTKFPVYREGKPTYLAGFTVDITERKRAEETLRESEGRLREAQALGRIGNWEFDIDRGTLDWSDETYALYERDPSLGPPTPEEEATYYAPEQAAALREYARRAIEAGEELEYDLQAKLPSGRTAFFLSSMRPLRDESGRVVKLFGTVQDITERKQAEIERERLLHDLDERVKELNCLYGISNVLARQYAPAEQLFQEILKVIMSVWYYSETVCARIISEGKEHRTQNFRETPWKLSSDILARGEPVGAVEVYYLEERPAADEGPFQEAERDLINAVAIRLGEAVERKRARDALRESEERYRSVVENANESIVVAQDGILKFFNPKALELTGYSAEELGSKPFVELVHPDDRPMVVERHLQRLKGEKFPSVYPFRIVDKNGVIKWLEIAATLIDWEGRPATLNFLSDITERKQAEETLNLKNQMLISINDYIQAIAFVTPDRLFTTIVTKLKEITGAAEVLINGYDEEKSELVCLQSTLSEERNSWIRKTLGGSLVGLRTPVSKEKYEEMTSSVIGRVGSIHEVTFGAIPAPVGKIIEKVFGFGWFVGLALKHDERLVGTIMIAGKAETTQPENEELAAYTTAIANVLARRKAETALAQSEERYRDLFEEAPASVTVADLSGTVVDCNEETEKLTGYARADILGKRFDELMMLAPRDLPRLASTFEKILRGEVADSYELEIIRKDGERRWVSVTSAVIRKGDEATGIQIYAVDITERRQAEEAVRDSEARYRVLFEHSADGILIADLETRHFRYANPAICRMLGYTEVELKTMGVADIHPKDALPHVAAEFESQARGEKTLVTIPCLRKDGTIFYADVNATSVEIENETCLVGFFRDITERKQAEEKLFVSGIRYRKLFEEAPASITVVDLSGMIVDCNEETENLTGHARADILGKRFDELMTLDPHDLPRLTSSFEKVLRGEVADSYELEIIRKDGERRWVRVTSAVIRRGDEVTGIQLYAVDITESKRAEEALRESEERYREVFEGGIEGIFVIDAETMKVVLCNRLAAQTYEYESPELTIGVDPLDFVHPDERERAGRIIVEDFLMKDSRYVADFRTLTKSGKEKWISAVGAVINYQGKPAGLVSFRDITEQKQAQEEIKRHVKRTEALYAVTQAVSKTLNLDELVNEALKTTLDVMDIGAGGIYVSKLEPRELVLMAHRGLSREFVNELGIVKLSDEELARGLRWTEPVFELEKVLMGANLEIYLHAKDTEGLRSIVIVPFWTKSGPAGGLALAYRHERDYSPDEIDLLKAIANEIAIGIENAKLLEKTREMSVTDELTGIYNRRHFYNELDTEIHRMQRYGRFLSIAMLDLDEFKNYNDTFGHANGDVMLRSIAQTFKMSLRKSDTVFRYGGDEFIVILPGTDAETARMVIDRIRSTWAEMHKEKHQKYGKPIGFSTGIAQFPDNANTPDGLVFLADAALFYAKRRGGAQSMMASELNTLSPEILSMATREQVYALSATVDAKDPYTYGHSNRVAAVAETIAKSIGMSGRDLADVYAAAILHDIGKLGVPDAILTKPGKLTDAEWKIIYQHPAEGAKIIVHVKELARLIPMIRHHHEWYNGTGYPDRLKGDEIPLGARIISVADAYDTMTTKRLYRNTITPKEALKELKRCSVTQFDPKLVQSFSRNMEKDSK